MHLLAKSILTHFFVHFSRRATHWGHLQCCKKHYKYSKWSYVDSCYFSTTSCSTPTFSGASRMSTRSMIALLAALAALTLRAGGAAAQESERPPEPPGVVFEGETRLGNVAQLTFGGQNAEAYWSPDGTRSWFFQVTQSPIPDCDQIYVIGRPGGNGLRWIDRAPRLHRDGSDDVRVLPCQAPKRVLFSSTHLVVRRLPGPSPDHSQRIRVANLRVVRHLDGRKPTGLGAASGSRTTPPVMTPRRPSRPDGEWIVFTSTRDGDLDLYKMRTDGTDLTRLTDAPGLRWRGLLLAPTARRSSTARTSRRTKRQAPRPTTSRSSRRQDLIRPGRLEIWWMNADGTRARPSITDNGAANFAPYFTPDGETHSSSLRIVGDQEAAGTSTCISLTARRLVDSKRITTCPSFDSFPMFSPDGTKLAFASNRNGAVARRDEHLRGGLGGVVATRPVVEDASGVFLEHCACSTAVMSSMAFAAPSWKSTMSSANRPARWLPRAGRSRGPRWTSPNRRSFP